MLIGVPKEIKAGEYRVGLTPSSVRELILNGHQVLVETHAGEKIGFDDKAYLESGAAIAKTAKEIFEKADMVVKVKEPQESECRALREGQILFTYLHLAADPKQAELLMASRAVAIAYETVTNARGGLPLLAPMSEVAGRLSIQAGARSLEIHQGGRGVLLGGVPGVPAAKVLVIGAGVVGVNATLIAVGMGANVVVVDKSLEKLHDLDLRFGARIQTLFSTTDTIEKHLHDADLVIGAVLVPGASAPRLVTRNMLKLMKPGAVLVDVAIDQGGAFEMSHPTTHDAPTYTVDGVIFYCVANMPSAVPRTATVALNNATLPFVLSIANLGYEEALKRDPHLRNGLNVYRGQITHPAVAKALNQPCHAW